MRKLGVYIHIPFCKSKCAYCNFTSYCNRYDDVHRYIDALSREIEANLVSTDVVDTLYIGGGTPSSIDAENIGRILDKVRSSATYAPREVTIECNPESVTREKLELYRQYGITRISMGVQSLSDTVLHAIGRIHSADMAIDKARLVMNIGFDLSVDMILGLPYSTDEDIRRFVETFSDIGVHHISAYSLGVEEGTPLYKMARAGKITIPSDDRAIDEYDLAYSLLLANGYKRYEVSNFARNGHESLHNNKYWQMDEYIGFGVASHSYIDGVRRYNPDAIDEYFERIDRESLAYTVDETLTRDDVIEETIMLGLRLARGVNVATLDTLIGAKFVDVYGEQLNRVKDYVSISDGYLSIRPEYMNVMNSIIVEILS